MPTVADPVELDLLRQWREPLTPRRILRDAGISFAVHAAIVIFLLALPEIPQAPEVTVVTPDYKKAVPLIAPRIYEPTQKAPNVGKVSRELDVRSARPAPQSQAPRFRPPAPAPGPVAEAAPPPVPAPVVEPPKIQAPPEIQAAAAPPPPITISPKPLPAPPPQPDKPKLAFQDVGTSPLPTTLPANPTIPIPKPSIPDALRRVAPGTAPGAGGTIVGDVGDSTTTIPNVSQSASAGRIGSNLQLLSDAQGVDFKPYLIQVLTAVRRNWLAIIPESARLGRRGRVLIQFSIDRKGAVPKLVIADGAGTDALDRAAVAAISASYPFPPLPADYKGDQIRLQLAFAYNMPTR